jgi:hypothetical protein
MVPYAAEKFTPGLEAMELLEFLSWCATAAGVVGLLLVGAAMALQLRRGEPGEGATQYRGFFIVIVACILASTAGPIVKFINVVGLV